MARTASVLSLASRYLTNSINKVHMKKNDFDQHTYEEHVRESMRWRNTPVGYRADNLIDSARINANDTMREQGSKPDESYEHGHSEEWEDIYRASLRSLLSDERDRHVRRWFYSRGFHF